MDNDTITKRIKIVTDLGLSWNPNYDSFVKEDYNIGIIDIKCDTDEEFDRKINQIKQEMKRRGEN